MGEQSLLLGTKPSAELVVDSPDALVLRLPRVHLADVFSETPQIATRFFSLLAMRMAARLRKVRRGRSVSWGVPRVVRHVVDRLRLMPGWHARRASVRAPLLTCVGTRHQGTRTCTAMDMAHAKRLARCSHVGMTLGVAWRGPRPWLSVASHVPHAVE